MIKIANEKSINTKNNIAIYLIHESWIDRGKISDFSHLICRMS